MMVELTPTTYLVLCALAKEGLLTDSDANPLLKNALAELMAATVKGVPQDLAQNTKQVAALENAGLMHRRVAA